MKAMTAFTTLAAAVLLPVPAVGQSFEGTVTYRMEGMGQNGQIVHHVKDRNTRLEFSAGGQTMAMLMNADDSKVIMLMPAQKQWVDVNAMQERMASMMGNRGAAQSENANEGRLDIEPTGQKETIAGQECEHYLYKSAEAEVDVCAAKGMGWYMGAGAGAGGGLGQMMGRGRGNDGPGMPNLSDAQIRQLREMFTDGFFPLKVVSTSPQGSMTLVATSIERKTLPASLFAPPSDYTEMKMPGH